jgi:multiple sugar transport system permease protein
MMPSEHVSRRRLLQRLRYDLLALPAALLFLLPGVWMAVGSLRLPGLPPPRSVEWLPEPLSWANYAAVFTLVPLDLALLNSLAVAAIAVPTTLLIASWAGFAMSQLPERWRLLLLVLAVLLRMVPAGALWLPRYLVVSRLGLIDSYLALAAPALMASSPLFVLIFYWSFRRIPPAVFEAARLDGLGPFGCWWRLALPQVRGAAAAVTVLTFVQYWSDFLSPLLYLKSADRATVAFTLRLLQQLDPTGWPLLMAGVTLMVIPVIALFLLAQRAFWWDDRIVGVHR